MDICTDMCTDICAAASVSGEDGHVLCVGVRWLVVGKVAPSVKEVLSMGYQNNGPMSGATSGHATSLLGVGHN